MRTTNGKDRPHRQVPGAKPRSAYDYLQAFKDVKVLHVWDLGLEV